MSKNISVEELHKKTAEIVTAKERYQRLCARYKELRETQIVEARLQLRINNNKRGESIEYLTANEVEVILFARMLGAEGDLARLQAAFNDH